MHKLICVIDGQGGGIGVSLIKIFGDQKIIRGRISLMNLVDHKILFEKHE